MFPKLSRYQVLGRLAVGGMAEVWLGRSMGFGGFEKLVVLKTILPNLLTNPHFVQMFVNEARVAAMLNHPNCVTIFELGKEEETLYIAMEYIEGFALSRVLKRAKDKRVEMPVEVLSRIACDALSGLEYAHKLTDREGRPLDLIHRDVSPDNLLLSFNGQTKLVDFGIAKATMGTMAATRAGTVKGKFGYIAPEYLRGERIDGRADLFALGVVLYRALTGARPFVGDSEAAVTLAVMQKNPATPSSIEPRVSPELSGVVMLALEKKPDARFDSARAMRMALEAAVKPAETDAVAAFLSHLWPVGDPERVKLTSLASGKADESSEPALESIVSQGFSLPPGALTTPPPVRLDSAYTEQATRMGVVPRRRGQAQGSARVEVDDDDDEPPPTVATAGSDRAAYSRCSPAAYAVVEAHAARSDLKAPRSTASPVSDDASGLTAELPLRRGRRRKKTWPSSRATRSSARRPAASALVRGSAHASVVEQTAGHRTIIRRHREARRARAHRRPAQGRADRESHTLGLREARRTRARADAHRETRRL